MPNTPGTVICEDCGTRTESVYIEWGTGRVLCYDCMAQAGYLYCEHSGCQYCMPDDIAIGDPNTDRWYCPEHANAWDLVHESEEQEDIPVRYNCSRCDRSGQDTELLSVQDVEGRRIVLCNNCAHILQVCHCDECGTLIVPSGSMRRDGHYYCAACWENSRGESHPIHSYSYNPEWEFLEGAGDKSTELFTGHEIEIETTNATVPERQIRHNLPTWVYLKSDSSIGRDTGGRGFEIVTHPMTINWINEHWSEWETMLTNLYAAGARARETETCGYHIHLSKQAFASWHLYKYFRFIYMNPSLVVKISQRNRDNLQRWANMSISPSSMVARVKCKSNYGNDRHCAVNLGRDTTLELRVFKGTINPLTIRKNIEFAIAVYMFARDNPPSDMYESKFMQWITEGGGKRFKLLRLFLTMANEERTLMFDYDSPQCYPVGDSTQRSKIICV